MTKKKRKAAKKAPKTSGEPQQPLWMELEDIVDAAVEKIRTLVVSRINSGVYQYREDCNDLTDTGDEFGERLNQKLRELVGEIGELLPYEDADDESMTPEDRAERQRQFDEIHERMNSPEGQAEIARRVEADKLRLEKLWKSQQD